MENKPGFELIIIGAGASGLYCAWQVAAKGRSVALLDHQRKLGRKVALAGGGKGNFTNRNLDPCFYVGQDPGFCAPILRAFDSQRMLRLLDELHLPYEEREFGQIFGLRPAGDFVHALRQKCQQNHVEILTESPVEAISATAGGFQVNCNGQTLRSRNLVLATGSPACPQSGASAQGLVWARQFGHECEDFRPALVPLLLPENWPLAGLAGLTVEAKITVRQPDGSLAGDPLPSRPLLFTHQGISGPAGLIASCWWQTGATLEINWLPHDKILDLLHDPSHGKLLLKNLLNRYLPLNLATRLLPSTPAERKCAEIGKRERLALAKAVHNFQVTPLGTAGLAKAEAARGGVLTRQLSPDMQSLLCPGLYFCGELVDLTGLLGGYNLHWAIASAHQAAQAL